jgi:hypothetical protein
MFEAFLFLYFISLNDITFIPDFLNHYSMKIRSFLVVLLVVFMAGCSKRSSSADTGGMGTPTVTDSSYIIANYFGNRNMLSGSEVSGVRSKDGDRYTYHFSGTSSSGKKFNMEADFTRSGSSYTGLYYEQTDAVKSPNPCYFMDNEIAKNYATLGEYNSLTITRADDAYTEGTFSLYVMYGGIQTIIDGSFKIRK